MNSWSAKAFVFFLIVSASHRNVQPQPQSFNGKKIVIDLNNGIITINNQFSVSSSEYKRDNRGKSAIKSDVIALLLEF